MRSWQNALLVIAAFALTASAARADYGGSDYGSWGYRPYNYGQYEYIPYYALHPPVYYSLPVPRSYGYSPFAYPPSVMTPEVVIEPATLENPYVPKREVLPPPKSRARGASASAVDRTAMRGMLINPYVASAR